MGVEPFACLVLPTEAEISTSQTSLPAGVHNKESAWSIYDAMPHDPRGMLSLAKLRRSLSLAWPGSTVRVGLPENCDLADLLGESGTSAAEVHRSE